MQRVFVFIILIKLAVPSAVLKGQSADSIKHQIEIEIERMLDEFDPEENGGDREEQIKLLRELTETPLNINRASEDEFMQVPGMTLAIANSIVDHRQNIKPFASVEELTEVRGIGKATLHRLRPYLSVGNRAEQRRDLYLNPGTWIRNSRFEAFTRYRRAVQKPDGYLIPDSLGGYIGSPVNYYQRFHLRSDHLTMNLTQLKSPGEEMNLPIRFDHSSWHIGLRNIGRMKKAVVGNYSIRFGQGLILRSGSSFGKGTNVIRSPYRSGPGIRGYTSSQPTNAFRGIALSYGQTVQLTGFYSNRRRTATTVSGDTIRFPRNTGVHNTLNDLERKNNTGQMTTGGRIGLELSRLSAGVNGYINRFSRPVQRGGQPYQLYAFEGTDAAAVSLDYRFRTGPVQLYGEAARTGNGGSGVIIGIESAVGDNTEIALAYRNYGRDFQSIFGSSFAEQSGTPRNEEGIYFGFRHRFSEPIRVSAYFDQFRFPSPRFQTHQPTTGHDWLTMIEYLPDRNTDLHLLIRQKVRETEYTGTDHFNREIRRLSNTRRLTARIHYGKLIHPAVRLRSRAEIVQVDSPAAANQLGYLIYQDIRLLIGGNLQIDARVTLFETEGFESRLYQFENDLLYVFSSTMLFDQGQRAYVLFNYQPSGNVQIWFKISTTIYENRNVIGSGLSRIEGNTRSDVGIQVRIRI